MLTAGNNILYVECIIVHGMSIVRRFITGDATKW